ncbi:MAG: NAD-dependent epimerase/dehydratase family protein [Planctomycetes bacterium]|nr:NAD-dependent epimerase/dehydratase family protein [Planctomycetota bacterium]
MKNLVTGASGFIGAAVVRHLLAQGEEVRVLVRKESDPSNVRGLQLEVVQGDLLDKEGLREAVKGCRRVYHVAALYALWVPDPRAMYEANVTGTRNVLEAAGDAGVERIVYTSTVGTIGIPGSGQPGSESSPVSIDDMCGDYKRSKFMAEQVALELAAKGLPIVIVNPSAPVGERDVKPTPTGQMIVDFLLGRMKAYTDTGLNIVDVDDVAVGHRLAAEKGKPGERYILGNQNLTLREFFGAVGSVAGMPAPTMKLPHWVVVPIGYVSQWVADHVTHRTPRVPFDAVRMAAKRMFFDPGRAVRELGLPQTPVETAIRKSVNWFRAHGYAPNGHGNGEAVAARR